MIPDWFRVDCDIVDSPKVGRLADALRIDVARAIGHVVAVFAKVRLQRPLDGSLVGVSDTMLEQWALWTGRRGRFAAAFRAEFVADGDVTGWKERQAPLIKRVLAERERAKRNRESAKPSPESTPDGTPTSTRTRSRTVLRQQEQEQEQRTTQPPSTRALALVEVATGTADSAVRPRLPAEYRPDLDALLDTLPADARPSWLRSMGAKLDGMHGPPVTPAQLGEALRAFGANGADRKLSLFDGYVRRAALPPRAPPNTALAATGTHGLDRRSAGAVSEANSLRGIALLLGEDPDPEAR